MRRLVTLLVLAASTLTTTAAGADSALKALLTGNDARGWNGVGRIDFARKSFCTGTLIADDLVLTAAHCLFDPDTGEPYRAEDISFLAGWRNGRAAAYRGAREAISHPAYKSDERSVSVAHDLALIRLDQPVRNGSVVPFPIEPNPSGSGDVGVVSYAFDRAESPSLQELCHVLARQDRVLVLTCDIDFGSSGAPVFVMEDGQPHIVSVIAAKAEDKDGRKIALGTDLAQPLAELEAMMDASAGPFVHSEQVMRKVTTEAAQPATGAKFMRP